jgi:hypothetical protein
LAQLHARGLDTSLPGVLPKGETPLDVLTRRLASADEDERLTGLQTEARALGLDPHPEALGVYPGGPSYEATLKEAITRARRLAAVVEAPRVQPARNDHPWKRKVWSR